MATRFYYTYDGPRFPASAAGDHPWTTGPAQAACYGFDLVGAKADRYALMGPMTLAVPPGQFDALLGVWYSPPLQPQDFTATVQGCIGLTSVDATVSPDMRIALVRADGSVRTWLYTGAVVGATAWGNQFPPLDNTVNPVQLPFVSSVAGDRLRVELGVLGSSVAGGTVTLGLTAAPGTDLLVVVPQPMVTSEVATDWAVFQAPPLTGVTSEVATGWAVQVPSRVTGEVSTSWEVLSAQVLVEAQTSWALLPPISMTSVVSEVATDWAVLGLLGVVSEVATGWAMLASVLIVTGEVSTGWAAASDTTWLTSVTKTGRVGSLPSVGTAVMTRTGGVLTPDSAVGSYPSDEQGNVSVYLDSMDPTVDQRVYFELDRGADNNCWVSVCLYSDTQVYYGGAANGYDLQFTPSYYSPGRIYFNALVNGTQYAYNWWLPEPALYSGPLSEMYYTYPADGRFAVRLQLLTSSTLPTYSVKVWPLGSAEPVAWTWAAGIPLNASPLPITPGKLRLSVLNQRVEVKPVTFSNLTFSVVSEASTNWAVASFHTTAEVPTRWAVAGPLIMTDFTAADGSPWPDGWTTVDRSGQLSYSYYDYATSAQSATLPIPANTVDIQGNKGRILLAEVPNTTGASTAEGKTVDSWLHTWAGVSAGSADLAGYELYVEVDMGAGPLYNGPCTDPWFPHRITGVDEADRNIDNQVPWAISLTLCNGDVALLWEPGASRYALGCAYPGASSGSVQTNRGAVQVTPTSDPTALIQAIATLPNPNFAAGDPSPTNGIYTYVNPASNRVAVRLRVALTRSPTGATYDLSVLAQAKLWEVGTAEPDWMAAWANYYYFLPKGPFGMAVGSMWGPPPEIKFDNLTLSVLPEPIWASQVWTGWKVDGPTPVGAVSTTSWNVAEYGHVVGEVDTSWNVAEYGHVVGEVDTSWDAVGPTLVATEISTGWVTASDIVVSWLTAGAGSAVMTATGGVITASPNGLMGAYLASMPPTADQEIYVEVDHLNNSATVISLYAADGGMNQYGDANTGYSIELYPASFWIGPSMNGPNQSWQPTTAPGFVYPAAPVAVRARMTGGAQPVFAVKLWSLSGVEPTEWDVSGYMTTPGPPIGRLLLSVLAGATAIPVTFSNLVVT